ncbi:Hypp6546 [Branchiostoma lanceolatum]|uniref:Hypp6546 protein n=1 Tax=Branchiostoma lanceolatum TaxID=7740 RepID=A0A8K0EAC7_BRALA|nr:Hypp6546 [Branchiostoma lanceolatum]
MRVKWNNWMIDGPRHFTRMGNRKSPSKTDILKWLRDSWDDIPGDIVIRSFRKVGISLAMDDTEDKEMASNDSDDAASASSSSESGSDVDLDELFRNDPEDEEFLGF